MILVKASTTAGAVTSVDSIINLNSGGVLPSDVNLYASAVDSESSVANFSFSWHLLRKPDSSTVALNNTQIQNPILEGVDIWGDYRLFCIATNTSSNVSSETDPIKAPNDSFVQVRVKSTHKALVKPAAGERDWFQYAYAWVDAIESYDPLIDGHETRITTLEGQVGVNTLANLTDTAFTTLVSGQTVIYNNSTGMWENGTVSSGAANLLLADTDDDFTLSMATGRLTVSGTANEVEVVGVSSSGGVVMTVGLPNQVVISDTLQVGGVLTALDELSVTNSLNILSDAFVTGSIKDSNSPYAYLTGKTTGWYMSDDGQAGSECKLMTQCTTPGTTTTTRGGVMLSTDKWNSYNTNGKLPSVHILKFSQQAMHTVHTDHIEDTVPDVLDNGITASQTGSSQITNHCHVLFRNASGGDISLETIDSVVLTGGDHDGQPYIFELVYYATLAELLAQAPTNTGITVTHTQASAWKPSVGVIESSNIHTVADGGYFGMRCVQAAKVVGHRYICNITAIRII
jgi:hypothetical protein